MITIRKLSRVIDMMALCEGVIPQGFIYCSAGGEIAIEPIGQLERETHEALIKKGFVYGGDPNNKTSYIYRPRK